jgi:hypothetical protein
MLGAALVVTSVAGGLVCLAAALTRKLSPLELVAGAAPVGFTASAWLSLLLKSFVFAE